MNSLRRAVQRIVAIGRYVAVGRLVAAVDEMALVHLMRERRDEEWSLAMIADAFNSDHIPGENGGRWYGRTVKNILENTLYQTVGA